MEAFAGSDLPWDGVEMRGQQDPLLFRAMPSNGGALAQVAFKLKLRTLPTPGCTPYLVQ